MLYKKHTKVKYNDAIYKLMVVLMIGLPILLAILEEHFTWYSHQEMLEMSNSIKDLDITAYFIFLAIVSFVVRGNSLLLNFRPLSTLVLITIFLFFGWLNCSIFPHDTTTQYSRITTNINVYAFLVNTVFFITTCINTLILCAHTMHENYLSREE